jgi:hypothetical protein
LEAFLFQGGLFGSATNSDQGCLSYKSMQFMKRSFLVLIILSLALVAYGASGQAPGSSWMDYETHRLGMNRFGMGLLIVWASVNIVLGIAGCVLGRGTTRYFFQMNAFWNLVNLGIGFAGYLGAADTGISSLTRSGITGAYHDMQNLFILNAGLDVAYIAIAFFLIERAKNTIKWQDLLRGYGYSLILQGGFLFVFDLVMFFVHKSHAARYLYPLLG